MIDLNVIASGVTILTGAGYVGRAMLRAAGTVRENTAATQQLADEFRAHRADVMQRLAEHGERLARGGL